MTKPPAASRGDPSWDAWIGREECLDSRLDPWPAQALRATLGLEGQETGGLEPGNLEPGNLEPENLEPGGAPLTVLPPLWSWLYFLETAGRDSIGEDGHAARGGFMPPIAAPRRMFAGGDMRFLAPLKTGVATTMVRRITGIEQKSGAAGPLVFVTLRLEVVQEGTTCLRETRDIVYLHAVPAVSTPAATPSPDAPVPDAPWRLDLTPDPVMLMRFSALTFNSHRIHYDVDYARDVEGYAERVVHGPLTALLLAEMARRVGGMALTAFSFRARAPLFCGRRLHLRGTPDGQGGAALAAYDAQGRLAMSAQATGQACKTGQALGEASGP